MWMTAVDNGPKCKVCFLLAR